MVVLHVVVGSAGCEDCIPFLNSIEDMLGDDAIAAMLDQQAQFAAYVGDLICGLARSRVKWGLDFLLGYPRKAILLATAEGAAAATDLHEWHDVLHRMYDSAVPGCIERAGRSSLGYTFVKQLRHLLQASGWTVTDTIKDLVRAHFSRVESTKLVEEAHRAHNAYVRRSPVRRIGHNTALYALSEAKLLEFHEFEDIVSFAAEERSDMVIADSCFEPSEVGAWTGLKGLPGWSRSGKWYSPAADCIHDNIADLLVCKHLDDLAQLSLVQLWLPLLSGSRTIVQDQESSQWYLCLATMGGACGMGLPLTRHTMSLLEAPALT